MPMNARTDLVGYCIRAAGVGRELPCVLSCPEQHLNYLLNHEFVTVKIVLLSMKEHIERTTFAIELLNKTKE